MLWNKLAIVDVETTGGRPPYDRVIEVGIVTVDYGIVTGMYSQLLNPDMWLPPEITRITGIRPEQLEDKPRFEDVVHEIFPYLDDRVMVAHNARFDLSFMKSEFSRMGYSYTPKHFCSVRLSRQLFPHYTHHSLDALIQRFGIEVVDRHRALDDALAVWRFFELLPRYQDLETIAATVNNLSKAPALPPQLAKTVVDSLPQSPGVYIFYNQEKCPLYVGKSVNVKERVLSHFYADLESPRELAIKAQVTDIEVIPAAGDLEAQLTEARMVKELQPIYNRQLRVTHELVACTLIMNEDNYLEVVLSRIHEMPENMDSIYGIYKSIKQAETSLTTIAKENHLCWKFMGLENATKSCFAYHLGECKGACIGKEKTAHYNLRVLKAFGKRKLMAWPYKGAVAIKENSPENGRSVTHVFEAWHHLGTYETENKVELKPNGIKHTLDMDTYKILRRYFQRHPDAATLLTGDTIEKWNTDLT